MATTTLDNMETFKQTSEKPLNDIQSQNSSVNNIELFDDNNNDEPYIESIMRDNKLEKSMDIEDILNDSDDESIISILSNFDETSNCMKSDNFKNIDKIEKELISEDVNCNGLVVNNNIIDEDNVSKITNSLNVTGDLVNDNGFKKPIQEEFLTSQSVLLDNTLSMNSLMPDNLDNHLNHASIHNHAINRDFHDRIKEPEEADHDTHCPKDEKVLDDVDPNGWIYILGHDQLKKRTIIKGNTEGQKPINGQIVVLSYKGFLVEGEEIDSATNVSIILGDDEVIPAFDLCISLMYKGETCELVTESRFGYGSIGRLPQIPINAKLTYTIVLHDILPRLEYCEMSLVDRIQLGIKKRERGNKLYSYGDYTRSIEAYTRALKVLDDENESHSGEEDKILQQFLDTRIKCYNNLAATQLKIEAWDAANKSCDAVLKVQPNNVKALFRKGKSLSRLRDTTKAIFYLKKALNFEQDSKAIQQELQILEMKCKAEVATERNLYKKMLGINKEQTNNKSLQSKSSSYWKWYIFGGLAAVALSVSLASYRYSHF